MKDSEQYLLFIVALGVACVLFWGIIMGVKKSFSISPPEKVDSSSTMLEQRQRSRDVLERQKRLMEDQRQRIRDLQRR